MIAFVEKKEKYIKKEYGLLTAISMIVGICIGSGIFFKSDNILKATGGNVFLGILMFMVAAFAIVFGSLTISELASRSDNEGGLVTYGEFISPRVGCLFGWFQIFVYYPTIVTVVSWVVGIYSSILFNLPQTLNVQILIGFSFLTFVILYNIFIPKLSMIFQNGTTIIKMLPLFIIGVLGLIYGDPVKAISQAPIEKVGALSILTALGPIAYSFDGWICATAISGEVKDAKKTLPIALTIAPFIILGIYILYFVGVTSCLDPQLLIDLGDSHVTLVATQLLGPAFAKAITIFIVISVMGTVNGLTVAYARMPYSLAIRGNLLPKASKLRILKKEQPVFSIIFCYLVMCFWMIIHYTCTKYSLLMNSDISEISIAMSYILYMMLYYKVFKMYKDGKIKGWFKGVFCPIMATLGSFVILSGAIQNPLFIFYLIFCIVILMIGNSFYNKHRIGSNN